MSRGIAVVLGLVVLVGTAHAQAKRKVKVETEPAGAVVFVGDKESGAACDETPCTIEVPAGEALLIIEMAGYAPRFESITVPRRGAVKLDTFTLEKAIGKIIVPGPKGAKVTINDEDKGEAPLDIEIEAGSYGVVLTLGERTGSQFVDVEAGGEVTIDPAVLGEATDEPDPDPTPTPGGSKRARGPIVSLAVSGASGFRSFTYDAMSNQRNASEGGTIIGATLQLWPTAAFGVLPGLFIRGKAELPMYRNPVEGTGLSDQAETLWQHFEAGLHYQWLYKGKLGIQGGGAWMRDYFDYSGTQMDREILPRTIYSTVSLGAQVSYRAPVSAKIVAEPYLAADNRIVLSGGAIEDRYTAQNTSTSGFGLRVGSTVAYGPIGLRLEFSYLRFSWDFGGTPDRVATSGTDSIKLFGFAAGYAY